MPGISFPIEKVAVGSCSCFAIIQNRSCFHRYLKEFLDVNQSEEQKEDLGFALQCTNDKFVTVHSAIAAIYQLPGCIPCSREVVILGLRLLYGELTDRNIVQWVRDQAQDEWKFS